MIFYTGSYTQEGAPASNPTGEGIGCFTLDLRNGNVSPLGYFKQRNPSYLAISKDKHFLYAVEEMYEDLNPELYAYRIMQDGKLSLINKQKLFGDYACHIAIIKDRLVVANYVSGNVLSYPILEDGSIAPHSQLIQHSGIGPNAERQEAAHAHMVYPYGDKHMYVVDLSLDKAVAYRFDEAENSWFTQEENDISIASGAGARHMIMDSTGEFAYILSELTGEIFVAEQKKELFDLIQNISFVPQSFTDAFGGAAIRLHPNGKFLYASCRGANTLAIFKIDAVSNKLTLVGHQSSGGETPRDFNIDPTGQWLIAANQDSNSLVVFKINQDSGELTMHSEISVDTPVNITWLD
ncbi:lactonase family protein [Carboxylicivirga sp. N1Y90]|uniref:lactonase family protein n=1 Tax=Carboxylicivirga fragile TaxID=3417571 RepID=UPI003D33D8E7|nr:lactonase family protein [Marinilabiliaceae bacterium N1Y90]